MIGGLGFVAIFVLLAMAQIQTTQEAEIQSEFSYTEQFVGADAYVNLTYPNITINSEVVTYNFGS